MSGADNKAVVQRMIEEVWNEGNLDVVDQLVGPDYVGHDPSMPAPIRGVEGFRAWVAMARQAFPDFHIEIEELLAEGDRVAGRITMAGTQKGPLGTIPPTERHVSFGGFFVRRLAGGRFVEGWDLSDTLTLMTQLGALPAPR